MLQQHLNDKSYSVSQGYVVGNGSGRQHRIPTGQWFGDSMVPDFTSSATTNWWMNKRAYMADDVGIDGFKADGSEQIFRRNLTFADGRKGDQMHNADPNSYTDAYNTFIRGRRGATSAIFATCANMRMNCIPYLYTEAKRSAATGAPLMRAMSVEFPSDPNTSA